MIKILWAYILHIICIVALLYLGLAVHDIQKDTALLHNQNKFIMKHLSGGVQNISPTHGNLRAKQETLLKSLVEFDKLAKAHSIEYWLDFGTLLGAIRHNRFIPWDDDIDIGMTEENLTKLRKITEDSSYNTTIKPAIVGNTRQRLWHLTNKFGTFDIFSHVFVDRKDFDCYAKYASFIHNFKFLFGKYVQNKILDRLDTIARTSPNISDLKDLLVVMRTTQARGSESIARSNFNASYIFPLKRHIFEGYEFPVPNNCAEVLTIRYGKDYNDLPDDFGYSHHIYSW